MNKLLKKTEKKYKCTCVNGGGIEQESTWEIKIMPKSMKLKCIATDCIWGSAEEGQIFTISLNGKNNRHGLRIWKDDLSDFTAYPDQNGTPYHFELYEQ